MVSQRLLLCVIFLEDTFLLDNSQAPQVYSTRKKEDKADDVKNFDIESK